MGLSFTPKSVGAFFLGLVPFTGTTEARCSIQERQICEGLAAVARIAPDHVADGRSAPIQVQVPNCARDMLNGRSIDRVYEGVDIRLRAENMSHGG